MISPFISISSYHRSFMSTYKQLIFSIKNPTITLCFLVLVTGLFLFHDPADKDETADETDERNARHGEAEERFQQLRLFDDLCRTFRNDIAEAVDV